MTNVFFLKSATYFSRTPSAADRAGFASLILLSFSR
jgi:hypothetical protein